MSSPADAKRVDGLALELAQPIKCSPRESPAVDTVRNLPFFVKKKKMIFFGDSL